jgi:AcrR family transcriptional regulator
MVTDMNTKRAYTMTARAEAAEATRMRILQATVDLASTRLLTEIGLDSIAEAAGVSVQTVLRRFGSRAALIEAAMDFAREAVAEERRTPVGDVRMAVRTIVEHYERRGDTVLLMIAQEASDERLGRLTQNGRVMHRAWVEEVFAPQLAGRADAAELVDLLVVATDVYTWKLLRRDRRLSRAATEQRMLHLLGALLDRAPEPAERQ